MFGSQLRDEEDVNRDAEQRYTPKENSASIFSQRDRKKGHNSY